MGQAFSGTAVVPLSKRHPEEENSSTASSLQQALPIPLRSHGIRKRKSVNKSKVHTITICERDENIAERIKSTIVGESIQVFWTEINAWVDCKVIVYESSMAGTTTAGMHCVEYADGMKEWRTLREFRVVSEDTAIAKKTSRGILSSRTEQNEEEEGRNKEDDSDARSVNTPTK